MNLQSAKAVADAVLYEGYILYPYRASAVKNQQRFNFGVLAPRSWSQRQAGNDAWCMRTECLLQGTDAVLEVHVRFLQLIDRVVSKIVEAKAGQMLAGEGGATELGFEAVPALEVDGTSYHSWQEALERDAGAENLRVRDLIWQERRIEWTCDAAESVVALQDRSGRKAGQIVRRRHEIHGMMLIKAEPRRDDIVAVMVEIQNITPFQEEEATRDRALVQSLISAHTILGVRQGKFISLLEPPESMADLAALCQNIGAWPVLVGKEGQRDLILSSPIILYDYPQIAPESGHDYFDCTEMDELLALRVLTLTDDEKREMCALEPRAREILQRTESLPPEQWQKLHGAIRGLKAIGQT